MVRRAREGWKGWAGGGVVRGSSSGAGPSGESKDEGKGKGWRLAHNVAGIASEGEG